MTSDEKKSGSGDAWRPPNSNSPSESSGEDRQSEPNCEPLAGSEIEMPEIESSLQAAPSWDELLARMNQNQRLLVDVLSLMIQESPRLAKNFSSAVNLHDARAAKRAAHTLKSNCRQLGLSPFADFASRLEQLASMEDLGSIARFSEPLQRMAQAIADWSRDLIEKHQSSSQNQ
jgi:HPt (histidine-containing phosphotransfer) domain-containing protein